MQFFSLIEANPPLLDLLIDICGTAPELARYLGRNAGVLDAVISRDFYRPLRGAAELRADLAGRLAAADGLRAALNAARIWMKERHFRIGVHLLRGLAEPGGSGRRLFRRRRGGARGAVAGGRRRLRQPPRPARPARARSVVAMGKLGSREMTASSDLDLIVIYDAEGAEASTASGRSRSAPTTRG